MATEEGPRLLQDAGKDGVAAVGRTLAELAGYFEAALLAEYDAKGGVTGRGRQDPSAVPPAYATPRVQRALAELATQLRATHALADRIRPK